MQGYTLNLQQAQRQPLLFTFKNFNMNNKKTILVILAVLIIAYFYIKSQNKKNKSWVNEIIPDVLLGASEPIKTVSDNNTIGQSTTILDKDKLLKKGSKGDEVKELQKMLGIKVDGIFGSKTEGSLKGYKLMTNIQSKPTSLVQTTLNQLKPKTVPTNWNPSTW